MAISLVTVLRSLFGVLGSLMLVTLVYTIFTDGLPFRSDLLTPWMAATLIDFYINIVPIAAWIFYKESNWITAVLWIILLVCFGSVTTCGYTLLQLMKLSTKESENPIYYVLLCHPSKGSGGSYFLGGRLWYSVVDKHRQSPVLIARVVFSSLGLLMLGTLLYTLLTDGSPFRKELFTPHLKFGSKYMQFATLVDFYINVTALSVWVVYKEQSWITAAVWIILLICFGSITTCVYILIQLSQLTSQDPIYLALFKSGDRAERRSDGVLI